MARLQWTSTATALATPRTSMCRWKIPSMHWPQSRWCSTTTPLTAAPVHGGRRSTAGLFGRYPPAPQFLAPRGRGLMRGFTLLELLVAVTIVGVLSVMALPGYQGVRHRTQRTDARLALLWIQYQQERHYAIAQRLCGRAVGPRGAQFSRRLRHCTGPERGRTGIRRHGTCPCRRTPGRRPSLPLVFDQ